MVRKKKLRWAVLSGEHVDTSSLLGKLRKSGKLAYAEVLNIEEETSND